MSLKVAVVFSGLVRGDYYNNIERFTQCFDEKHTDFYFTTWQREYGISEWGVKSDAAATRIKVGSRVPFINHYFKEPRVMFGGEKLTLDEYKKVYRKMLETNWDLSLLPANVTEFGSRPLHMIQDDIMQPILTTRRLSRHQHKQVVAHAWACEHLFDRHKYDVIVRIRYDAVASKHLKAHIKTLCQVAYDTKMPVGFNHFNNFSLDGMHPGHFELKFHGTTDLHDFVIIHRADMIDPSLINYLYEEDLIRVAEVGWYSALCEPYDCFSWESLGLVKLQAQQLDENKFFNYYSKNRSNKIKDTYKERMRCMVGNIAQNIDKK